jgi:hypothetical protein
MHVSNAGFCHLKPYITAPHFVHNMSSKLHHIMKMVRFTQSAHAVAVLSTALQFIAISLPSALVSIDSAIALFFVGIFELVEYKAVVPCC